MIKTVYKLTNQKMQTRGGYQWRLNKYHATPGTGELCSRGWLHFYYSPELAMLLNPIHANIDTPKLFEARAWGQFKDDHGLKGGATRMKLKRQIPFVEPTNEQYTKFAILCEKESNPHLDWINWANNWLSGADRSPEAAELCYNNTPYHCYSSCNAAKKKL
jgi:hypothetical protein